MARVPSKKPSTRAPPTLSIEDFPTTEEFCSATVLMALAALRASLSAAASRRLRRVRWSSSDDGGPTSAEHDGSPFSHWASHTRDSLLSEASEGGRWMPVTAFVGDDEHGSESALRVELIGGREFPRPRRRWLSGSDVPASCRCTLHFGPVAVTTEDGAPINPLWCEAHYFAFDVENPPPSPLTFLVQTVSGGKRKDVGTVVLAASTVARQLEAARAAGRSSWRPYFLVAEAERAGAAAQPPRKDTGVTEGVDAFSRALGGEAPMWESTPLTPRTDDHVLHPHLPDPAISGRLYLKFSLVRWRPDPGEADRQYLLPQPRAWPPADPSAQRAAAEARAERERGWTVRGLAEHTHPEPRDRFRIIAFDGGGARGVLTAALLQRLLEYQPRLLERADAVAGTSTGAIIAVLLASGYSAEAVRSIYRCHLPDIFDPKSKRKYNPFRAAFKTDGLREIASLYIGKRTLADLEHHIVVPAFKVDGRGGGQPLEGVAGGGSEKGWFPGAARPLGRGLGAPADSRAATLQKSFRTCQQGEGPAPTAKRSRRTSCCGPRRRPLTSHPTRDTPTAHCMPTTPPSWPSVAHRRLCTGCTPGTAPCCRSARAITPTTARRPTPTGRTTGG